MSASSSPVDRGQYGIDAVAILAQRRQQGGAVLDEDIAPDAPVAARDARHVAKARSGTEKWIARAGLLPGLGHEQVRKHVWQMTYDGQRAVVFVGVDGHRSGADLKQEVVERLERLGAHVGPGSEEVRRSFVE